MLVRLRIAVLLLLAGIAAFAAPLAAQESSPGVGAAVLPPDAEVAGLGLAEWSARAYQWQFSFPASINPSRDATGERCAYGQSGPVFFLATAESSGERHCTIPSGVTVFVPLIGSACSTVEPPPWFGRDEAELRACAAENHDSVPAEVLAQIGLTVDGQPVGEMASYRAATPAFDLNLPPDNLLGVEPGIALAVADGYQVLLAPLAEGEHEVVITVPGPDGPIVMTYRLTVAASGAAQEVTPAESPAASAGTFDGRVDVGDGRMLHVRCAGSGSPTIVFDAGGPTDVGASTMVGRAGLATDLAGVSRFCAYDRAFLGASDPAPDGPRTIRDSAADLHALLSSPELACPCVLLGESWGGGITLVLAATHPEDVAGLVLVDPPPPGYIDHVLELAPAGSQEAALAAGFPNPENADFVASLRQVETPVLPASIPVVVLTHGEGYPPPCFPCSPDFPADEAETWWQEAQAALAEALHGELVIAEGSGHFIVTDRPDLIVAATQDVVAAVRDSST